MYASLRAIALALLLAAATGVQGETVYVDANEVPRPIDVARALAGAQYQPVLKKRGLSLESNMPAQRIDRDTGRKPPPSTRPAQLAATPAQPAAPAPQAAAAAPPSAPAGGVLAVAVAFRFASADLTPPARAQLDAIAEGLKLLQADAAVTIEGHTDAIGAADYNLALSDRRAEAVRHYLVEQHGIAAQRLKTVGKGEAEPLNDTPPNAARNRRVAFRLG